MAAVMSPSLDTSSPATSPSPISSPVSNPNHPLLPPLITTPTDRRPTLQRPNSFASRGRLSQYSNFSAPSRSRPPSHVFPIFHSSLPYTLVRDFAYPILHPMHYGPPPEPSQPPSGLSTPASDTQKWSSDPPTSWDTTGGWGPLSWASDGLMKGEQLAPIHIGDGPPWSEDEDLQSPVVVSSRHKKPKPSAGFGSGMRHGQGYVVSTGGDGSNHDDRATQDNEADGSGGEFITYPPEQVLHPSLAPYNDNVRDVEDSHAPFAVTLPKNTYHGTGQDYESESEPSSSASSPDKRRSSWWRDYRITIASPDEEMHGKAVALFDFERENENELPLVEGQVIWVSYRHGQGWLVAQDPRTRESGLVPEEYVRLLRDIQGGLTSLTGQGNDELLSPVAADADTPTQADHNQIFGHAPTASNGSNGYQLPIVSTFSTSSKDLHPYPQHLLGTQVGQAPPQVTHYHGQRGGSQGNTPTLSTSQEGVSASKTASQDAKLENIMDSSDTTPVAIVRPDSELGPSISVQQPRSPTSQKTEEMGGTFESEKDVDMQ